MGIRSRPPRVRHAPACRLLSGDSTASQAPSGPTSRKLWVSENGGKWGTTGRYVSTVVQGTHWLTQDECTRSEVQVVTGRVQVRNLVAHETKTLTAGQHYAAASRKRQKAGE